MTRTYPATIAGLTARPTPGFDREQWTTCSIGSRGVGDVFAFRGETPLRQVVLTATRTEAVDGETHGRVIGEAIYLDNGDTAEFKLRANDSVLTRCDLRYTA